MDDDLDDELDDNNFDLLLRRWSLLTRINRVPSQKAVPIVMPTVLIAQEALDSQRVPLVVPVMLTAPWAVLTDQPDGAARAPIVIPAPRAIPTLHLVGALA